MSRHGLQFLYGSLKCDKNYIILKTIVYYCVELNLKTDTSKCMSNVNLNIKIK